MLRDKLLPGTKPGFLKSEKMLRFILLYTHKVYQKIYVYNIIYLMDVVIPLCWHIIIIVADVIAMWSMLNHIWFEVGVNLLFLI